ncbi:MAG: ZIP family metal transporter [Erysipelotrichales bacterium]|nr:ZIP family metal transporter [Erysipelotrichales bacterium]
MTNFFYELNVFNQALIASMLTFTMTVIGAATVFLFKNVKKEIMNVMISLSAGIMLSAAIFSLLLPAIEQANNLNLNTPLIISISILLGSLLLIFGDKFSNKYILSPRANSKNTLMLIVSIVLHNIPEGMAIGCAFGSIMYGLDGATVAAAISLAIGVGIQNFPEGAAISIPLRNAGYSRLKSFTIGALTGIVEPIGAIAGVILVLKIKLILPYLLAFAAGAMIFVVMEELIPEFAESKFKSLMSYIALAGFVFMMILEII